jgi:hypothetical protein
VILQGYREINSKYFFQEYVGKPYAFCARVCLADVDAWKEQHGYQDPILSVFEDGANDKSALVALVGRDKYAPPTFGQKREHTPCRRQILLRGRTSRYSTKRSRNSKTQKIEKTVSCFVFHASRWGVYTIEKLEEICKGSVFLCEMLRQLTELFYLRV